MDAFGRYVRNESRVSAAVSALVSALVYSLVFKTGHPVVVGGVGGYAFDFVPQSFMTALLCTWLPGAISRKRRKSGLAALSGRAADPRYSLLLGGLVIALVAAASAGGAAMAVLHFVKVESLDWTTGLAIKLVFAAILGLIVTPYGLRRIFPIA